MRTSDFTSQHLRDLSMLLDGACLTQLPSRPTWILTHPDKRYEAWTTPDNVAHYHHHDLITPSHHGTPTRTVYIATERANELTEPPAPNAIPHSWLPWLNPDARHAIVLPLQATNGRPLDKIILWRPTPTEIEHLMRETNLAPSAAPGQDRTSDTVSREPFDVTLPTFTTAQVHTVTPSLSTLLQITIEQAGANDFLLAPYGLHELEIELDERAEIDLNATRHLTANLSTRGVNFTLANESIPTPRISFPTLEHDLYHPPRPASERTDTQHAPLERIPNRTAA